MGKKHIKLDFVLTNDFLRCRYELKHFVFVIAFSCVVSTMKVNYFVRHRDCIKNLPTSPLLEVEGREKINDEENLIGRQGL